MGGKEKSWRPTWHAFYLFTLLHHHKTNSCLAMIGIIHWRCMVLRSWMSYHQGASVLLVQMGTLAPKQSVAIVASCWTGLKMTGGKLEKDM